MREKGQKIPPLLYYRGPITAIAVSAVLTLACFGLSTYWRAQMNGVMGPFQDCYWVHTIPGPDNCADDTRMATYENLRARSQITFVLSVIGFLGVLFVPAVLAISRENRDEEAGLSLLAK